MRYLLFLFVFVVGATAAIAACGSGTTQSSAPEQSPERVVEQLWKTATEGQLLTPQGWDKASRAFFADHFIPPPGTPAVQVPSHWKKPIHVVSNNWGVVECSMEGNKAVVVMEYYDAGLIDPRLNYTPGKSPDPIGKTAIALTLLRAPTRYASFRSEGSKLIVEKVKTGPETWQLEHAPDLPWTTVNSAVRYVLEIREHTKDPVIKKNADRTLSELLKLHF